MPAVMRILLFPRSFPYLRSLILLIIAVAILLPLAFRGEAEDTPAGGMPPAMPVQVLTLKSEETALWSEFSGKLAAVDYVQVRPRVSGAVTEVKFKDGAPVKKGQELFTIDTRPYEAEIAKAKAAVNSAQSQAKLAKVELDRAKALLSDDHVSQSLYDQRASAYQVTQATIGAAQAQLKQAQLNLEYAHVKAPISGRAGRAEITVGNVVESGMNAPVLTTILDESKMYAEFDVDERTYLTSMRELQGDKSLPVEVTLADDDKIYPGHLHSFDNRLDPNSGTIRARALLENSDHTLIPGMYAKIRLQREKGARVLLPEAAIGTDQSKKFALVVDKDNKVEYRELTLGQQVGSSRVVEKGLKAGDRVILTGLAMLQPGMAVIPQDSGKPVSASESRIPNPES